MTVRHVLHFTRRRVERLSSDDPLCQGCATTSGLVHVTRPVGHWFGPCAVCGEEKDVTARRDYIHPQPPRAA